MAVPKKRTSKTKSKTRKSNWMAKTKKTAKISESLAKSLLKNK
ncbi:MAG: 50S ribosomal protein L32 [Alphaproteobacteria bacterium]|nr:50S ribosomal protein L32 [Alphaproteobacteria bacterium]